MEDPWKATPRDNLHAFELHNTVKSMNKTNQMTPIEAFHRSPSINSNVAQLGGQKISSRHQWKSVPFVLARRQIHSCWAMISPAIEIYNGEELYERKRWQNKDHVLARPRELLLSHHNSHHHARCKFALRYKWKESERGETNNEREKNYY